MLLADGHAVKYFAIVTNGKGDGLMMLICRNRGKANTAKHMHHVLKNESVVAVLPSGKFGTNVAWFRLNVLTYELHSALKRSTFTRRFLRGASEAVVFSGVQHGLKERAACPP